MTSVAGRSGSVQTNRRSSLVPGHRSGRSSRTQTARTTRPLRKRAATRQVRYRTTSSLPWRIRALRCTGSASILSRVIRGPYLRGRPRRRRRGGRGTAYSARSRRARPITVWPSASAASISRARMNQASSRSRTRPSRRPGRRSRKRAPTSLPRWVPRRTRRSISGTAPTRQPRSATAARHSQPWPRRNRDRFGLAAWSWGTSEPGARLEIRSTTVSSMTTCQTGGANNSSSTPSSARQTASHVQRPRWRNQEEVVQERDSPAARIASVTWPPRVVAAPSSSSVKVVRARRGTASARRPTSVVRIGGTAVVGMARAGEGGRAVARPDTALNRRRPPRLAPRRRPRHAHQADRVPVNFRDCDTGPRKKPGSRGGWLGGGELDDVAEVGEAADEPPGLHLPGAAVEVVGAEVRVDGAVLQHVVGGGQDRGRHRAHRLPRPAAGAQAVVLGLQVARPLPARRPGALHQRGLEPRRALAQARGAALARALVVARAHPGPGDRRSGTGPCRGRSRPRS